MIPHHSFSWFASIMDHVRFVGALVNPFNIRSSVALARRPASNVALLEREDSDQSNPAARSSVVVMKANLHDSVPKPGARSYSGVLIINADDWGRDRVNTDRILDCVTRGTVSSASAMVFMEDSERSAELAREHKVDTGLHLNLSSPLSAPNCPPRLAEEQAKVRHHLLRHRLSKVLPHPGLARSFAYVVSAQLDEYERIYGRAPTRLDGHHHMHLCADVRFGKLIPEGIIVRRNFSFLPGEKSFFNRRYRAVEDQILAKRYRIVDYFFSIVPFEPKERLERLFTLAREHVVELETHPVNQEEYRFLMGDDIFPWANGQPIASSFTLNS
jgi:chitin disaccharide deacetylase